MKKMRQEKINLKIKDKYNVLGVGIDAEEIYRFGKEIIKKDFFLKSIFTKEELGYCLAKKFPEKHLAARFAAKEALYKAVSKKIGKNILAHTDIEITNEIGGQPKIKIKNKKLKGFKFLISLSHSKTTAVAIVLLLNK